VTPFFTSGAEAHWSAPVGQARLPEGRVGCVTPDDTHQQCSDDERFPNFG